MERIARDYLRLNPDIQTAQIYGQIKAALRSLGKPIPNNDIWIAAIARQHGFDVFSNDTHFDAGPNLKRIG